MTFRLEWRTPDAPGTAMRLASVVGGHVDQQEPGGEAPRGPGLIVPLVGGEVVVVPDEGPDRLVLGTLSPAPDADPAAALRGAPVLLGVGWATVDADRALPAIAAAVGVEPGAFRSVSGDESLGAAAHVGRIGSLAVVVLEPSTEGRVAAALARVGEGPCAIYVSTSSPAATQPGPLGPAIVTMADRRWGPFVVAVRRRVAAPR